MARRLVWKDGGFNTLSAKDGPYEYVVWGKQKSEGELRVIRKENMGGVIYPIQDFSIFARDRDAAMKLAEKLNRIIRKARRYNGPISL
jgi:hypothetical protein